jgi:superfamily II DNA helicase RecQ
MRESNSREGKREVSEALTGGPGHGIQILYMSPERFAHRQVRSWLERAAERGILHHIAIDEAHTLAQWGEDFRPSFRRLTTFISALRQRSPQPIALTRAQVPAWRVAGTVQPPAGSRGEVGGSRAGWLGRLDRSGRPHVAVP